MLPRSQRLSVEQFNSVMEKGRVTHSTLFILRHIKIDDHTRISAAASKKIAKKAVNRNEIRRKIYNAIQPIYNSILSNNYIIVFPKDAAIELKQDEINKEVKNIFVKAGLIR